MNVPPDVQPHAVLPRGTRPSRHLLVVASNQGPARGSETVTLRVPLTRRVMDDLLTLAELYHATPERMVSAWAQTQVENLMVGLFHGRRPTTRDARTPAAVWTSGCCSFPLSGPSRVAIAW